jgi:microcystin-dependent protein
MGQPYVGEIRMFGGNFAPAGWLFCSGQLLPISENETLFNLIGTTYGGDGQSTFALPNLQSRVPVHVGTGGGQTLTLAEIGGQEQVTLTTQTIPLHTHNLLATASSPSASPNNAVLAVPAGAVQGMMTYAPGPANVPLHPQSIQFDGGSQPHDNLQPYLCVAFIISLFGVFPSPT